MRSPIARLSFLTLALALLGCGTTATQYTLTVQKTGTGSGLVTGDGIECGATCTLPFASGTSVTLTATGTSGSVFSGWTNCDSTTATMCVIAMTSDQIVGAAFTAPALVHVSGNITAPTTWLTGKIYQVTRPITVSGALTIQPGATVMFDRNASMVVTGSVTAKGNPEAPIVFTSASMNPAGGDWVGLVVTKSGSAFDHCAFLFAGAEDNAALTLSDGASAEVTHSTFAHHRTPTLGIGAPPALDASHAAAGTVIRDNVFFDNRVPLTVNTTFSIDANAFDNAAGAPSAPQPNLYNAVFVAGCAHVKGAITWPGLTVPYVIGNPNDVCDYLVVDEAGKLTIGDPTAKAVVKFFPGGDFDVRGTLIGHADFTSIRDDARGGDTNADSTGTSPAGSDWGSIALHRSGSSFEQSGFFFGGAGDRSVLWLDENVAARITGSTFAHNVPANGSIAAAPALDATGGAAGTVISGNTFWNNTVPLAINTTFSLDDSNAFTNDSLPNQYQAIVVRGCGHVTGAVTWAATRVPLVIGEPGSACGFVTVDSGAHLTLGDGVVLKFFPNGSLLANGVITANGIDQIVFTAFADDAHGGDTNADRAASAPAAGNWNGIQVAGSGSSFDHCSFFYGGGAAVRANTPSLSALPGASVSVTRSLFAYSRSAVDSILAPAALDLSRASPVGTAVRGNRFFGSTKPLAINAALSLDDTNFFDSGVVTGLRPNRYNGIFVQGCSAATTTTLWLATQAPFVIGDLAGECSSIAVEDYALLLLGKSVTLKFVPHGWIDVKASGSFGADASDRLTSLKDDYLNDTNGDEGTNPPAMRDWKGVRYAVYGGLASICDESSYLRYHTPSNPDHSCSW